MDTARVLVAAAVAPVLAAALVACGSDDSSGSDPAGGAALDTQSIEGAGTVYVDSDGRAVYVTEQEKAGDVLCVDACLDAWMPVAAESGEPTGDFGSVTRPDDGSSQLTWQGSPVYTFVPEQAGEVTGDNLSDGFGGTSFTWHVVRPDGSAPPADEESGKPPDVGGYY